MSIFKSIGKTIGKILPGGSSGAALGAIVGSAVPGIGTALGAGIGGALGSVSGYLESSSASQLAKDQRAQSLADWNMQNDYNNPTSQMARLKAAGLNPMLVYGSGNVTGNSSSSIEQTPVYNRYPQGTTNNLLKVAQGLSILGAKEDVQGKALDNEYKTLQLEYLKARIGALKAGHGSGNASLTPYQLASLGIRQRQLEIAEEKKNDDGYSGGFWSPKFARQVGQDYMTAFYDGTTWLLNKMFGKRTGGIFDR